MFKEDVFFADPESEIYIKPDYEIERNKPMPNRIHARIQKNIVVQLDKKYNDQFDNLPEVSLNLKPSTTPDVSVFEKKLLDWRIVRAKEDEMPITTIEIISPSQSTEEIAKKIFEQYFPAGVKSAWLVEPPPFRCVRVFTPDKRIYFDSGTVTDPATGIQIEVEKIFEGMI